MSTKIAVILTVLVMLSIGMAVFILMDYVTIGKPAGEEAVAEETAENPQLEGEGAQTTLVAAATTVAGTTKAAPGTTAAGATTKAGSTTAAPATTAAPTTTTQKTTSSSATTNPSTTTTTKSVPTKPELYPTDMSLKDMFVVQGGTLELNNFTVVNASPISSGSFNNGFYISLDSVITASDRYLTGNSNNLPPESRFDWGPMAIKIPDDFPPGSYHFGVLVDKDNQVDEQNENNNYWSTVIVVEQKP